LQPLTNGEEMDRVREQYTSTRGQPEALAPIWPPSGVDRSVAEAAKAEREKKRKPMAALGLQIRSSATRSGRQRSRRIPALASDHRSQASCRRRDRSTSDSWALKR
jgi:hypothetical protein